MNKEEIIINLESRAGKKKSHDFARMRALLANLENPHMDIPCIQIAGTNGKGSTSSFVYNMLKSEGYKVGLYTSPHLETYNERIRINDILISDEDFVSIGEEVLEAESKIIKEYEVPTFFEIVTAIAFLYFKKKKCDYIVLEVGMGGAHDSTNVVLSKDKLASVITPISMDHGEYLGENVAEIAVQKAGIIVPDTPVFSSNKDLDAVKVLKRKAAEFNNEFYDFNDVKVDNLKIDNFGAEYDIEFAGERLKNVKINLIGYYQMENSVLALMTLLKLRSEKILKISDKAIYEGLNNTKWAGRMETVSKNPHIVIDGAHNYDGIINLTRNFSLYKYNKLYIIASILSDKEHEKMLDELAKYADEIILTDLQTSRKSDLITLKEEVEKTGVRVELIPELEKAIEYASGKTNEGDLIIISGSLYLVSDVKKLLNK